MDTKLNYEDFLDTYGSEQEATFMYELGEYYFEALSILNNIQDMVKGSDFAVANREKVQPYVERIEEIIVKMDGFLY